MRCDRVQATAEVRRAGGGSGYFCKDRVRCAQRRETQPVVKAPPPGDVDREGRLA